MKRYLIFFEMVTMIALINIVQKKIDNTLYCEILNKEKLINITGGCGGYHINRLCFLHQPGCNGPLCWGVGEYHSCSSNEYLNNFCTQTDDVVVVCTCLKGATPEYSPPLSFSIGVIFNYIKGPDCFS